MIRMTRRDGSIDDADDMGITIVSASFSTFLGHIPEEDLDLTWTPKQSADNWRAYLSDEERPLGADFFVADIDGTVIGFIMSGADTGRVDFEKSVGALYVRPSFQSMGISRALLSTAAKVSIDKGVNTFLIGCIRENPSCDFHTHLGGKEIYRLPRNVDRYQTEEIFFGYSDISRFLSSG